MKNKPLRCGLHELLGAESEGQEEADMKTHAELVHSPVLPPQRHALSSTLK